jgi:uncharacterized protein YecE (DUF72 family)
MGRIMNGGAIHIGTSGWYYDHWDGILYPPGLPKAKRFQVYAQEFDSVEINATYYRLPSESMVAGWYQKAPSGFVYSVKAHKEITHVRKLRSVEGALSAFLHAVLGMQEKLGAILFQLPPSLQKDLVLLREFLHLLPSSPRCCLEFRHASWESTDTFDMLAEAGCGHVVVSMKGHPFVEQHTSGIAYYRLHGPEKRFGSPYPDAWLYALGSRIRRFSHAETTCYVFFNNDIGGHAVRNARTLKAFLREETRVLRSPGESAAGD